MTKPAPHPCRNRCRRIALTLFTFTFVSAVAWPGDIRTDGKLISTEPTDPPLEVASTAKVPNLNADRLDGFHVDDFAVAGSGVGVHYANLVGLPGGEIDQDCAVNTGCIPGDTAGFPVTITASGSYRLTGNLAVPDADTTAISIDADGVTLDLGGFTIQGVTSCTGTPAICTDTGIGDGVSSDKNGLTIRNGHVRGMGARGIIAAGEARISGITAVGNGNDGITTATGRSLVMDCVVRSNGVDGLDAKGRSIVRNCVAENNGNDGIVAHQATVLEGNAANGNGGNGIVAAGGGSVVRGNTARDNGDDGMLVASLGSMVIGNAAYNNDGFGLNLAVSVGYSQNSVNSNTGGTVAGGIDAGGNVCNDALGCP